MYKLHMYSSWMNRLSGLLTGVQVESWDNKKHSPLKVFSLWVWITGYVSYCFMIQLVHQWAIQIFYSSMVPISRKFGESRMIKNFQNMSFVWLYSMISVQGVGYWLISISVRNTMLINRIYEECFILISLYNF